MSKLSKSRRLAVESLENRRMMAGDVHAFVSQGTLFINEAAGHGGGAQNVLVSQLPDGKIQLTGRTSPVNLAGSLINGGRSVVFSGVNNIQANLGGGPDNIVFETSDAFARILSAVVNTTGASTANDDDVVVFNNFKVVHKVDVATGAGNDDVQIAKLTNSGEVHVKTGSGDDKVRMKDSTVGVNENSLLWFDLGGGNDTLLLGTGPADFYAPVKGFNLRVDARDGADRVVLQDQFFDAGIAVQLGVGDDVLEMRNVKGLDVALRGQEGNDTMKLTEVEAYEDFFANLGDGSDTLDVDHLTARTVELAGDGVLGDGYDRLFLRELHTLSSIRTGFEEINGQRLIKKGALQPALTITVR